MRSNFTGLQPRRAILAAFCTLNRIQFAAPWRRKPADC